MLEHIASFRGATCAWVDQDRHRIWVALSGGRLLEIALDGATVERGPLTPAAAGLAGRGALVAWAAKDGTVTTMTTDARRTVTPVAKLRGTCGQVAMTVAKSPTVAVVTQAALLRLREPKGVVLAGRLNLLRSNTALSTVRVADGTVARIAIAGLTGVAVAGKSVFVARNTGTAAGGQVALLNGSQLNVLQSGLPAVGRLGVADGGASVLVAHPESRQLTMLRPGSVKRTTVSTAQLDGTLIEAHGLPDGRIAILTSSRLVLVDRLADLRRTPAIGAITDPLFVSAWTTLNFSLGDSGLSVDEVFFRVPDGPSAGIVSYTRVNGTGDPLPLLVAGGKVGRHKVELVRVDNDNVIAHAEFEVTDHWSDAETGPPGFYTTDSVFSGDGGWGGGPQAPQNIGTHQATGIWRTMVLMVDTDSARWPSDAADLDADRADLLGHISTGILFNGEARSVRQYYEENSHYVPASGATPARGLSLSVLENRVFGPINLPGGWTSYFHQPTDDEGNITDHRWWSIGTAAQTIVSRAIADGVASTDDFSNIDTLIIIPRSPDSSGGVPARFVWPHAGGKRELLCGTDVLNDKRQLAVAFGPLDFAAHDGRQLHTTMSHELGHTLGLPDLYSFPEYSDDVDSRLTSRWDMMAGSNNALPHYTLSNKMRMGWIEAAHLKRYDFQRSGSIVDTATLHAAELGAPPAGRFKGLEIRLGDGWNYYVEYRAKQATQMSDGLPQDRRVVITDVTSDTFTTPIARPPVLLVRSDIDGDGPILDVAADFQEKDPGTQMDLKVEVVSTDADNAVVKLTYGANGKPELGIRPWTGGPSWQSPDIEIRNEKTEAEPDRYHNVPWLGHDNTVIAKIRNSGDLYAKDVKVDFFVTEYTTGDGPMVTLGTDTRDVEPGATVEFSAVWAPPANEGRHYCIIVRIQLYQDPGNLAIVDNNIYNNEARSNYTQFVSASASPSSRVGAQVLLANPFGASTLVFADVRKTHPYHRVFVDHQWLRVGARGQRAINVWDEAMWGTAEWPRVVRSEDKRYPALLWKEPNRVSIAGWASRPFPADCGARTLTGGVGMRIDAGRATRTALENKGRGYVFGQVDYVDNGGPIAAGGRVLLEVTTAEGVKTRVLPVEAGGRYGGEVEDMVKADGTRIVAHFLGHGDAAPSVSAVLRF